MPSDDDIKRLIQELAAAPTRAEATAIFEGADWLFVDMHPRRRERLYERITDIIAEKPE